MNLKAAIAIDTETTGLNSWKGDCPFAVSMCDSDGETWYCEWPVDPKTRKVSPNPADLRFIRRIMEDASIPKVLHNAKFDIRMLEVNFGIKLRGELHDTMFMAHSIDCLAPTIALKPLAMKFLDISAEDEKDLQKATISARNRGKKLGYKLADDVKADYWLCRHFDPSNQLCEKYAILDVERTIGLYYVFCQGLEELENWDAYMREMALWSTTYEMETRGVAVDMPMIDQQIVEYDALEISTLADLRGYVNDPTFNPGSHPMLADAIVKLSIPVRARTPTGMIATSKEALAEYKDIPFIQKLMEHRRAGKTNEFFHRFHELAVKEGMLTVLHPNFNQVGPVTNRYSCRDPNLQNVPNPETSSGDAASPARRPFGPRPGYFWYSYDYSQLEVRIFAFVSQEEMLLKTLSEGKDAHKECCNKAWGGPDNPASLNMGINALELRSPKPSNDLVAAAWEEYGWTKGERVSSNRAFVVDNWLFAFDYDVVAAEASLGLAVSRHIAKQVLFAKIFGGGVRAVVQFLDCSFDDAKQFLTDYDLAMPGIKRFISSFSWGAKEHGYIRNVYDRRVNIDPDLAYRSINYLVQGSAAELLKSAMLRCNRFLKSTGLDAHLVMTIHDELVFEVKQEHAKMWLLRELKVIMEDHQGKFGDVTLPAAASRIRQSWAVKEKMSL